MNRDVLSSQSETNRNNAVVFTTREELKSMSFSVAEVRHQSNAWSTGGILGSEMPSGWFVVLEPDVDELDSDHCAVGLKAKFYKTDGIPVPQEYACGTRGADGRICLFVPESDFGSVEVGDSMKFFET